LISTDVILIKH